MIRLKLSLPCPVNRRFIPILINKGGRKIAIQSLSPEYRKKQSRMVDEIWKQLGGKPKAYVGIVQVSFTVTPRDRRTADSDAYFKALYDGLQKAGIVTDDKQIKSGHNELLPNAVFPGCLDVEVYPLEQQP